MPTLLLEIGTEELPSSYIEPALGRLCQTIDDLLEEEHLGGDGTKGVATPRRLTASVSGIIERQGDVEIEVAGPPKSIAFDDDGNPTKAGAGFAKKQGVDVSAIFFKDTPKGEYCAVKKRIEGRAAADILAERLPDIITSLPFPKSMRWRGKGIKFARPIRTLVALLDDAVVPFEIEHVASGRTTQGHPFLAPGGVDLPHADFDAYVAALRERKVLVDMGERKAMIRAAVDAKLKPYGTTLDDVELLDDVVNLVEYPTVIEGDFDARYLQIPAPVVVEAMREHQKYFAVYNAQGELQNKFLAVINRDGAHVDSIRAGNERVLEARLADAEFFWQEDCRTPLREKLPKLQDVIFQDRLGSYFSRADRMADLATFLARSLGLSQEQTNVAQRAAKLAKVDLVTLMVGEFPKLQGAMGKHYALHDGEPAEVAEAIAEHYLPRKAGGALPQTLAGALVSLADKLDAIVCMFSIGLAPTGSQDPYALRRQAQGVIRIVREKGLSFSLSAAVAAAQSQMPTSLEFKQEFIDGLFRFFRDRIAQMALDEGRRYDIVNAVLAAGFDDINDTFARLEAVEAMSQEPYWPALVAVVERTHNMAKNCPEDAKLRPELLKEDAEMRLAKALGEHRDKLVELRQAKHYLAAAKHYHDAFAEPVHTFFDQVFVNVDDEPTKNNRLALLRDVNALFSQSVADLSEIVQEG